MKTIKDIVWYNLYLKRRRREIFVNVILFILTMLLAVCMLSLGNRVYTPDVVWRVFQGEILEGATFAVYTLRFPRMLAGTIAGIAFGIAGNNFQMILRNPLASPDMIGITSGASASAVFCILILGMSGGIVSFAAIAGGLIVAAGIYLMTERGHFSGGRLILIGIGVQAVMNAIISYLLLKASQYDIPGAMRWLSGSLNGVKLSEIPPFLSVLILAGSIPMILTRQIKILELGEEHTITLGVRINLVRGLLLGSSVILIACATAVTGPISFVAFLSGPIARRLVGAGNTAVIASGMTGAILVLLSDLIGQMAFSTRYPVGVITGILGAPYLLFLLIQMNKKGNA